MEDNFVIFTNFFIQKLEPIFFYKNQLNPGFFFGNLLFDCCGLSPKTLPFLSVHVSVRVYLRNLSEKCTNAPKMRRRAQKKQRRESERIR